MERMVSSEQKEMRLSLSNSVSEDPPTTAQSSSDRASEIGVVFTSTPLASAYRARSENSESEGVSVGVKSPDAGEEEVPESGEESEKLR
jgi:hypothetical protein